MSIFGYNLGNLIAVKCSKFSWPTRRFTFEPEPYSIGLPERGKHISNGFFLFEGHLVEAQNTSIWDIKCPNADFEKELHGFGWLDHLAADGSAKARNLAKQWFWEWIERFGGGLGPGWCPQLTGRRIIRVINHSQILLFNESVKKQKIYFKILGHQANFLSRRAKAEKSGLKRLEALTGLIFCASVLKGKEHFLKSNMKKLNRESMRCINKNGDVSSRNPEELMHIFIMLSWAARAIIEVKRKPLKNHLLAIELIAPNLRALRLGNGGLVHFHGGGRGMPGRLDQALSEISNRLPARIGGAMGYHRISNNGTILIMDVGAQIKKNEPSFSALAFELSIGHEELIVNTGPGMLFGNNWLDASRTLYAHSGVCIDETTPSVGRTDVVPKAERKESADVVELNSSHDGFALSHGVLHYRKIEMNRKGSIISGRDTILADGVSHCGIFDGWLKRKNAKFMPFNARFHISPDVNLEFGIHDTVVSMTTPKGDVWILRSKNAKISIQQSAYMQYGRLNPRAAKQVVVSGSAVDYQGVIEWTLSRLEVMDH